MYSCLVLKLKPTVYINFVSANVTLNILFLIINILRWIVLEESASYLTSSYNLQNIIEVLDDSLPASVPYDAILISEYFHFH